MAEPAAETAKRAWLKAAEVCDLTRIQPYVLRTWEAEFPDLGVARASGAPRVYRQTDVDLVLRIKQLVFSDGLTLAGARRRIDEERAAAKGELPFEEESEPELLMPVEARARLDEVRQGMRALLDRLSRPVAGDGNGHAAVEATEPAAAEPPAAPARKSSKRRKTAVAH